MPGSYDRNPSAIRPSVNLYCAQCESQLGIFENEWIRLTSSYARSKQRGTHFATEVGERTQVVPSGPTQKSAEGCRMAEVFCRKCSNMVGQYCTTAPDAEKQQLVGQYFYKLSRTFLRDSRSSMKAEPVFSYGSDIVRGRSSRAGTAPQSSLAPTPRWASKSLRQSSTAPVVSLSSTARASMRQQSHESQLAVPNLVDDRWEQSSRAIQKLQDQMASQRSLIQDQSNSIAVQTARIDDQETRLREQEMSIEEHENCLSAQAAHIVEQDGIIGAQTKRLQEQQTQLTKITTQLIKLQHTMDDLKKTLIESRQGSTDAVRIEPNHMRELATLRAANESMKSRLSTIANAMGTSNALLSPIANIEESSPTARTDGQVLGKRKRSSPARPALPERTRSSAALPSQEDAVSNPQTHSEQMPTPQSSDADQQSPEQAPQTTNSRANSRQTSDRQPPVTKQTGQVGRQRAMSEQVSNESTSGDPNPISNIRDHSQQNSSHQTAAQQTSTPMAEVGEDTTYADDRITTVPGELNMRKGRQSKSLSALEIANTDDEMPIIQSQRAKRGRATRSATKAKRPKEVNMDEAQGPTNALSHVEDITASSKQPSAMAVPFNNSRTLLSESLLEISPAANILGTNLEASTASAQARAQAIDTQQTCLGAPVDDVGMNDDVTNLIQQERIQTGSQSQGPDEQSKAANLDTSTISTDAQYDQIQFIEDSAIYDIDDLSDDNDDWMEPDTALYGDDSLNPDLVSLPVGEDERANPSAADGQADRATEINIRQGRSMAPEPIRPKKPARKIKRYVNLDRAHIATPQMFAAAYAIGVQPKATRPPILPTRERDLNAELTELGLAEWIGRDKNRKEYRQAVAVARARLRSARKAAFLQNKGLNYNPAASASPSPEMEVPRLQENIQSVPRSEIANVPVSPSVPAPAPVPAPSPSTESLRDEPVTRNGQDEPQNQPRATRARTRRSSIPILPSLEEAASQALVSGTKQAPRKRKSDGRRKSQRKSNAILENEEVRTIKDRSVDEESVSVDHQDQGIETAATVNGHGLHQKPKSLGRRVSGKARDRSRRSAASEALLDTQARRSEEMVDGGVGKADHGVHLLPNLVSPSIAKASPGNVVGVNATLPLSSTDQAQLREEAILLRDRMAKELMEQEDLDM